MFGNGPEVNVNRQTRQLGEKKRSGIPIAGDPEAYMTSDQNAFTTSHSWFSFFLFRVAAFDISP